MKKILAGNCIFVRGYNMNLIFDVQNTAWYHIKESEEEILSETIDKSMKEYLEAHGIVLNIPDFLLDSLPMIETTYQSPQSYEGIIIDIDANTEFHIPSVLKSFDDLNPFSLQLRFYSIPDFEYLKEIIDGLDNLTIESTELILPYSSSIIEMFEKDDFLTKASKVFRVIFHSIHPLNEFEKSKLVNIYYSSDFITNHQYCGQVSALNFSSNPKQVFKSLNFNSCLYKKIGIDVQGNIKNCPSLSQVIGNINDTNFELNLHSFSTDKIKKDDIEVCQDCEFRHICTDCRAFTDSNSRPNARPSKCQYNPYISKWSHEGGYKTLEECGVISNEQQFSIDHDKIALINKELWEDE